MKKTITNLALICIFALFASQCTKKTSLEIPHLEKRGNATQLIVDSKPFLALAGELHNSSSSGTKYMDTIWPKLVEMNLNTVLAAVSWDLIEPEEGKFDFSLVNRLIDEARLHNMRLVFLWFGSWKNGISHYVPEWAKKDTKRFPRVLIANGKHLEVLTTLSEESVKADARAFAALMKHIRETDAQRRTVIMIQVQNEVGLLGGSRDRCDAANKAFGGQAPTELMEYLQKHKDNLLPEFRKIWEASNFKTSGTWEEIFGKGLASDEIFMAWNYACYVNRVAEAGKAEYPLPMFVNAWIVQPEDKKPGDYPSGGPQAHVHDIWKAGAPQIDILAPDIYLPNFTEICQMYSHSGNALFVPESFAGEKGVANAFYAIGQSKSIGYSPFGIETRELNPSSCLIAKAYKLLSQLTPLILDGQSKGTISAVSLNKKDSTQNIQLGNYTLQVELRHQRGVAELPTLGYGLFISTGTDEYIVAGADIQITFFAKPPDSSLVGIASLYEGIFENNKWIPGRKLNGDDIMLNYDLANEAAKNKTGSVVRLNGSSSGILKVKLYKF